MGAPEFFTQPSTRVQIFFGLTVYRIFNFLSGAIYAAPTKLKSLFPNVETSLPLGPTKTAGISRFVLATQTFDFNKHVYLDGIKVQFFTYNVY